MKTTTENTVTRNFLQFCYTCEDAHLCTTEKTCQACWAEAGLVEMEADGAKETQDLLQMYYA